MDGWIDDELYAQIEASVPIVCVDFVLRRLDPDGRLQYALARRNSPFGEVWCHFGGRVLYGETISGALRRHVDESIWGASVEIADDPQTVCVFLWFPDTVAPVDGSACGHDPRKHAMGLGFVLDVHGEPLPVSGGEAREVGFFRAGDWPEDLWPGCREFFARLLPTY